MRSLGDARIVSRFGMPHRGCRQLATGGGNTNRKYFRFAALFLLSKKRAGLFKPATFFIIEFILQNREVRGSLELQFALVLFLPLGYDARVEKTAFFEIGT